MFSWKAWLFLLPPFEYKFMHILALHCRLIVWPAVVTHTHDLLSHQLSMPFVVKGSYNRILNVLFNRHNYLAQTTIRAIHYNAIILGNVGQSSKFDPLYLLPQGVWGANFDIAP